MAKRNKKRKAKPTLAKVTKKSADVRKNKKKTINFDYIKSNQFRVIHADGVHGGLHPKGYAIQMAFFSERQPIPRRETYNFDGEKLTGIKKTDKRDAIVREVEVEVILDLDMAISLHKWLSEKIEDAMKIHRGGKKK